MGNTEAIKSNETLRRSLGLQGFIRQDLPNLLLDKKKMVPATKKEITSLINFLTPPSNANPSYTVKETMRTLDLGLDQIIKYHVRPVWEKVFDKLKNDLTEEERKQKRPRVIQTSHDPVSEEPQSRSGKQKLLHCRRDNAR